MELDVNLQGKLLNNKGRAAIAQCFIWLGKNRYLIAEVGTS